MFHLSVLIPAGLKLVEIMSLVFLILWSECVKVQIWEVVWENLQRLSVVLEPEAKVKRDTLSAVIWIT